MKLGMSIKGWLVLKRSFDSSWNTFSTCLEMLLRLILKRSFNLPWNTFWLVLKCSFDSSWNTLLTCLETLYTISFLRTLVDAVASLYQGTLLILQFFKNLEKFQTLSLIFQLNEVIKFYIHSNKVVVRLTMDILANTSPGSSWNNDDGLKYWMDCD